MAFVFPIDVNVYVNNKFIDIFKVNNNPFVNPNNNFSNYIDTQIKLIYPQFNQNIMIDFKGGSKTLAIHNEPFLSCYLYYN
jgi:hypothetical protein